MSLLTQFYPGPGGGGGGGTGVGSYPGLYVSDPVDSSWTTPSLWVGDGVSTAAGVRPEYSTYTYVNVISAPAAGTSRALTIATGTANNPWVSKGQFISFNSTISVGVSASGLTAFTSWEGVILLGTTGAGVGSTRIYVSVQNCPNLTTFLPGALEAFISSGRTRPNRVVEIEFDGCALNQASIDAILTKLSTDGVLVDTAQSWVNLTGGTNSAPSAGVVATEIPRLVALGFTVTTN